MLVVALWMVTCPLSGQSEMTPNAPSGTAEKPDTVDYINFRQKSMADIITDTTLNGNFYTSDRLDRDWPYVMNIGYSGSPVYTPYYYLPQGAGWTTGLNAFEPYRKPFEDLLFVEKGMPITKLTYIQTPRVNQSIFDGYFARKFEDISFALNHNRYNFTGDYLNQRSFNTIFNTGITIDKEKSYSYFLFASEVFQQSNNGGISDARFYGNPIYDNRAAFPVRFRNATTRDDTKKGKAGYMLKALQFGRYGVNTGLEIDLSSRTVSMNTERPDSADYFQKYIFLRSDGFNSYMKQSSFFPGVVLEFSDSTHSAFELRSVTGLNISSLDFINNSRKWQEFVQQGNLGWRTKFLNVEGLLDLRIFNKNVYFDLQGQVETDWRGFGVAGYGAVKRTAAPLVFYEQNFAGITLWNENPSAAFSQVLGGALHYTSEKMTANIKLEQLYQQNISYFDEEGMPAVLHDQTSLSLQPEMRIEFGKFRLENQLAFYLSENTLPSYPTLSGRHTLFMEDKWFKNRMHINLGVNVYWKNGHPAYYYLPYVQSFVPTEHRIEAEYRAYPFFAFRVKTFKFFIRYENINQMWQKDHAFYDNYHYPLTDPTMRMGIEWLFRN